jgi:SAM-dependent methyltransferase
MTKAQSLRLLYEAHDFPIFQNRMYPTPAEARACAKGDIRLVEDLETGLVYNVAFRPELMQYDVHYQNEQAVSPSFHAHLEEVAEIVESTLGRTRIVEVGCGKAYFLEMLLAKGFDVTGFDPTYEGDNPRVVKQYFRRDHGIQANGLVLRHVLEHVQDPVGFLMALKEANGGGGKIYIEVPSFDWICDHRAWFDVFYEHVNYFRLSDFRRMFGNIDEGGYLFGEQYLCVVADLATLHVPVFDPTDSVDFPTDFTRSLIARSQIPEQREAAIWGGASKGVIFALLRERIGSPVPVVIDVNPAKQEKYLPGTGLRVQSPAEALSILPPGATIFVMNSNYLAEIKHMSKNAYCYIDVDHD